MKTLGRTIPIGPGPDLRQDVIGHTNRAFAQLGRKVQIETRKIDENDEIRGVLVDEVQRPLADIQDCSDLSEDRSEEHQRKVLNEVVHEIASRLLHPPPPQTCETRAGTQSTQLADEIGSMDVAARLAGNYKE